MQNIIAALDDILDKVGIDRLFGAGYQANLESIAEVFKLDVSLAPELETTGEIGRIEMDDSGNCSIRLNPLENSYLPRRRFTLAHEYGHYFLHLRNDPNGKRVFVDNLTTMSRSQSIWSPYEVEANEFAANLLMPARFVIDLHRKYSGEGFSLSAKIESMAYDFGVSQQAMGYRLDALRLS